jgi:hypothetical protein
LQLPGSGFCVSHLASLARWRVVTSPGCSRHGPAPDGSGSQVACRRERNAFSRLWAADLARRHGGPPDVTNRAASGYGRRRFPASSQRFFIAVMR